MATIRQRLEGFIYPFYERYTDMVYQGGEETELMGVRLLDDDIKFTHGALVNAAATLYEYYVRIGDERASEVLKRLHYFIKLAAGAVCKTWGKIAILRAYCTLEAAGLVADVDPEYTALVKEKTNYEDLFDKEKLDTRGMATNYMQVAMACAAMRERLGWENDGYAAKIMEKLSVVLNSGTKSGWLDDEIPYGRFDRYTLVLSSEFADTVRIAGLNAPDFIKNNVRLAAEAMLFMANGRGEGVCYGRSVAIHGVCVAAEVLSTAFAEGLIKPCERDLALKYLFAIYEKKLCFWYDGKEGAFNMWWGGRGHDSYRPIDRLLETNLDAVNHLYMELKNLELGGVADAEINGDIDEPTAWSCYALDFMEDERDVRRTVILRRRGRLVMLPFVGFGNGWGNHSAYYPFPAIAGGVLEAPPRAEYPYFVPEYTDECGTKYRPVQYFDRVEITRGEDSVCVVCEGELAIMRGREAFRSNMRFRMTYEFDKDRISVSINTDEQMEAAEMITSDGNGISGLSIHGFDRQEDVFTDGSIEYCGTHGEITGVKRHYKSNPKALGYTIKL